MEKPRPIQRWSTYLFLFLSMVCIAPGTTCVVFAVADQSLLGAILGACFLGAAVAFFLTYRKRSAQDRAAFNAWLDTIFPLSHHTYE